MKLPVTVSDNTGQEITLVSWKVRMFSFFRFAGEQCSLVSGVYNEEVCDPEEPETIPSQTTITLEVGTGAQSVVATVRALFLWMAVCCLSRIRRRVGAGNVHRGAPGA